ncbi:TetR/AcrR family transcriptional regulator, lmrAB and yxaGH operons repressor [Nocardiopsis flavescens]|uniref:TetR/AcrR family transcriptional regulator, lmrAB and yxaGH operons repressor n=1 Tax=Nocardiopsis flavescens TaxID=758803 RepID=A0A1M6G970_9ACTN|nr:TetR/AcrR family transcriptional regulator [Nocardiopsis flavescens]SHJ06493.1 TetR/AcrR family transcriptional regulator, lmrAB and yxaGH operons repressor [Nocardiopsis flavescens]
MVTAARALIEAQGYFGTGVNRVLADSGAPRGSLYFHFPEGKDRLVADALEEGGREVEALLAAAEAEGLNAAGTTRRLLGALAARMEESSYDKGCPVATVALEVSGTPERGGNERLRLTCARIYAGWERALADRLVVEGRPRPEAEEAAGAVLAQIEGALLLARVRHDRTPLDRAARAVEVLLAR